MSAFLYVRLMMRNGIPCDPLVRARDEAWAQLADAFADWSWNGPVRLARPFAKFGARLLGEEPSNWPDP